MTRKDRLKVMIAGIGGASLGTEILKCLALAGHYDIFGCDISPTAYGLYDSSFTRTFLIDRENYIASVMSACHEAGVQWLIPGGEQPMVLLGAATNELRQAGITLVANHPDVIRTFSNKSSTFECLAKHGFRVPRTVEVSSDADPAAVGMPCIIKPSTGSGGSAMVFFAVDLHEAMTYADFIRRAGSSPLAQEYIPADEGEFTVGVLSLPDGEVVGSIALRRSFDAKLSVLTRGRGGLVSSGYSQGYIGNFPAIRKQAEEIAVAVGSRSALNIQGRTQNGVLIPFEINPRFSASTYLRAMAGFNEVDILLRRLAFNEPAMPGSLREGWYLRSLTERYVPAGEVKS
ncbi:MAG TPA: ATP-grasp domain-containing protein [Smithellaceae bacterium]|nr:ATP-grasp domain-containing protein [Smithellaceae bacterium]HOG81951.1 ATP-grasp domain-containing protein [Smithellaceae bacterium]